jgi:uncharacterized protein (DUF1697 family)
MEKYVILLRGLTPTGKNKVLMGPLRAALETAGFENVQTYIQSGNVLAASENNQSSVEALVHQVIEKEFGGDIAVLARPASEFRNILTGNPFKEADTAKLYCTLLATPPLASLTSKFLSLGYAPDQVQMVNDVVYVLCATQYSDVKANNTFIERKLKVAATTRVYKTIAKLVELSAHK